MNDVSKRNIVVGFNGTDQAHDALALGEILCEAFDRKLVLGCVFPFDPRLLTPPFEEERRVAREMAETVLREAPLRQFRDGNVERIALPAGSPARGLHDLAVWRDAGMLVLGSAHRGPLGRIFLGSVARSLLHGAPCPVAVAPRGYASDAGPLRTVAVGFDGSEEAELAAIEAARIAQLSGAALRIIAVVDTFGAVYLGFQRSTVLGIVEHELEQRLQHLVSRIPEDVHCEPGVRCGGLPRTLLAEAERGVDLFVLGSRGYGPVGSVLLGSVSEPFVECSPCPVVVVPRGVTVERPATAAHASVTTV